jgi:hypothetical protein
VTPARSVKPRLADQEDERNSALLPPFLDQFVMVNKSFRHENSLLDGWHTVK